MQAFMDENGEIRKPTKWYMGQYANNDGRYQEYMCVGIEILH